MKQRGYYFQGIHYIVAQGLWDSCPIVKLTERDFDILKDYILKLEGALYNATGLTTKESIEKYYEGKE